MIDRLAFWLEQFKFLRRPLNRRLSSSECGCTIYRSRVNGRVITREW